MREETIEEGQRDLKEAVKLPLKLGASLWQAWKGTERTLGYRRTVSFT